MHTQISSFLGYWSQKIMLSKFKRTFNFDHLRSGEPSPVTAARNTQALLHCSHHLFVFRIHFANDERQQPKQAPLCPDTTTYSHIRRRASPAAPCSWGHPAGSSLLTARHHPRHRPHLRLENTTGPAARPLRACPSADQHPAAARQRGGEAGGQA